MKHTRPLTRRPAARSARLTFACLAALGLLAACGGGGTDADDDPSVLSADLPPLILPSVTDGKPNTRLGRLVVGSFSPAGQDALNQVKKLFAQQTPYTADSVLTSGDVLVLDGASLTPQDLSGAKQLAARAYAAQVPVLILGFDDALEEASHKLLPTASVPGFNSMALLMPARPGQPMSDAAILLSSPQVDTKVIMTDTLLGHISRELLDFRTRREAITKLGAPANDPGKSDCSSSTDPAYCGFVQQTPLGRLTIADINSVARGNTNCLSRDWTPYASGAGRHYVGYSTRGYATHADAQCPSQVWNFFPVLYLTYGVDTSTGKLTQPSRVLYLGMSASLDPKVANNNKDQLGWYQTRHTLEVKPDEPGLIVGDDSYASPAKHGLIWLANTPNTQNGQTTKTDSVAWNLNISLSGTGGVQGGKPTGSGTGTIGGGVTVSHSTTNTIPDWKIVDNTDPAQGVWRFDAQQEAPYPVNDSTSAGCEDMGNFLFEWSGTHCKALPQHVRNDKLKDLSLNTMGLNGMMAWDLGSDNNKLSKVRLKVTTQSWFDVAGCARLTKQSKGGTIGVDQLDPKYVKSANCASNQSLPPYKGTWYSRAYRSIATPLVINLDGLEIPKPPGT